MIKIPTLTGNELRYDNAVYREHHTQKEGNEGATNEIKRNDPVSLINVMYKMLEKITKNYLRKTT